MRVLSLVAGHTVEVRLAATCDQRGEAIVIHRSAQSRPPRMFDVAARALGDDGMKGRRLPLDERAVQRVAGNARRRLDAAKRCMAGGALGRERVRRRNRSRQRLLLNESPRPSARAIVASCGTKEKDEDRRAALHSQRIPSVSSTATCRVRRR